MEKLKFEVTVKTDKGEQITEDLILECDDIPCEEWYEECHGFHKISVYDNCALEKCIEEIVNWLTPEIINEKYSEDFYFEKCTEIVDMTFIEVF